MARTHVLRAAAACRSGSTAAAGRCASPVHHGAAAPTRLPRAAGPNPLARGSVDPSSFTPRRRFSGDALVPIIPEEPPVPIPSFIRREVSRIESADIARHHELGQVLSKLTRDVTKDHSAARESRVRNATRIGTVTWRICTTVITVTVAAGAGLLQLAKPGWEAAAEEEAYSMVTEKVGRMMLQLEEDMVKGVKQRREVSAERSLLLQQKESALAAREEEIAARAAVLDKWEDDIVKKEASSN